MPEPLTESSTKLNWTIASTEQMRSTTASSQAKPPSTRSPINARRRDGNAGKVYLKDEKAIEADLTQNLGWSVNNVCPFPSLYPSHQAWTNFSKLGDLTSAKPKCNTLSSRLSVAYSRRWRAILNSWLGLPRRFYQDITHGRPARLQYGNEA